MQAFNVPGDREDSILEICIWFIFKSKEVKIRGIVWLKQHGLEIQLLEQGPCWVSKAKATNSIRAARSAL
jgi:hypothetical protein